MQSVMSFLPILAALVLMMAFNWSAKRCLIISWAMAVVFSYCFLDIDFLALFASTIYGMLCSADVLIIIFGAILVMNTLKVSGATAAINRGFMNVCPDKRVQACIVGFSFCSFVEAAAGFGTPAALAGPLLVSLGFPPMAAAMITLVCDSTAVSFGAVGTPVTSAMIALNLSDNLEFVSSVSLWTALPHAIISVFLPFGVLMMTTKLFSNEKSFKPALQAAPFALFTGLSFAVPMLFVSVFIGYEFASLIGAIFSVVITVAAAKSGFLVPKETWDFGSPDNWDEEWRATSEVSNIHKSEMSIFRAWIPYLLIAAILIVTRIPQFGLKGFLTSNAPFVVSVNNIFGFDNLDWSFKWAYLPGVFFILVALITNVIHKMDVKKIKKSWKDTFKQISGASVALIFGLALVEVMKYKNFEGISMMDQMANTLAMVGKNLYVFISPFIGALGAFVSGSATVSMNLFSNLQFNTATVLGLSPVFIISTQCVGAAVGNMICINNIVAASATIGVGGKEGKLIKINLIPMLVYIMITVILFYVFIALGINPGV